MTRCKWIYRILTVFWLCLTLPVWAAPDIFVILSGNSASSDQVVFQLTSHLGDDLRVRQYNSRWHEDLKPDDLIISVGNKAGRTVVEHNGSNPVIFGFVDSQFIASIQPERKNWTAVTLDQPLSESLKKASVLSRTSYKQDILIAISETNQAVIDQFNALGSSLKDRNVRLVTIAEGEVAAKVLQQYFYNAAALIAVRDNKVWNGNDARWILKQAYSYQVPIIGYSKSFLKAGALLALYPTLEDISVKVLDASQYWRSTGELPAQRIIQPDYQVGVNKNIARALKLTPSVIEELELTP